MDKLPDVTPVNLTGARPPRKDIVDFLVGLPDGWYRTRDLYPRYVAWAEREGKTPATVKGLGEGIRHRLDPHRASSHGNVSVYWIDADLLRGRKGAPPR